MAPARWPGVRSRGVRDHRQGVCTGLETVVAALSYRETGDPFSGVAQRQRQSLRVGLCSSLSWGFLRNLIRRIKEDPDGPELSFEEGSPLDMLGAAGRGAIDVAFVQGPRDWAQLRHEPLWQESLVVLMPNTHPLTRDSDVDLGALRDETFLVAGDPAERDFQVQLLSQLMGAGPPKSVAALVERSTLIDLVGLGFGVALTTGSTLGAFHPGVSYRPIAGPVGATVTFHAAWLPSNDNPALDRFLGEARALAAGWPCL